MRNFLLGTLLFAIIFSGAAGISRLLKSEDSTTTFNHDSENILKSIANDELPVDLEKQPLVAVPKSISSQKKNSRHEDKLSPDHESSILETPFQTQLNDLLVNYSMLTNEDPGNEFASLQEEIINSTENAQSVITLMRSVGLSQEEKFMLAQLLSARTDNLTIDFSTQLILAANPANQMLGAELANNLMIRGAVADTLTPILTQTLYQENKDAVRTVLYGVGNLNMSQEQSNQVYALLESYLTYGDSDVQPVALQSLASLYAAKHQADEIKQLYSKYRDKSYAESLRYIAVESLYNLNITTLDAQIKNQLSFMAEDQSESYKLRSLAMQILAK